MKLSDDLSVGDGFAGELCNRIGGWLVDATSLRCGQALEHCRVLRAPTARRPTPLPSTCALFTAPLRPVDYEISGPHSGSRKSTTPCPIGDQYSLFRQGFRTESSALAVETLDMLGKTRASRSGQTSDSP